MPSDPQANSTASTKVLVEVAARDKKGKLLMNMSPVRFGLGFGRIWYVESSAMCIHIDSAQTTNQRADLTFSPCGHAPEKRQTPTERQG